MIVKSNVSRTQIPIWVRGLEILFPESCIEMEFLHSVTKWEFGNEETIFINSFLFDGHLIEMKKCTSNRQKIYLT